MGTATAAAAKPVSSLWCRFFVSVFSVFLILLLRCPRGLLSSDEVFYSTTR